MLQRLGFIFAISLSLAACSTSDHEAQEESDTSSAEEDLSTAAGTGAKLPSFSKMWAAYPGGEAKDVKRFIGGNVDSAWITNTCTIRLSRSLNESGAAVPKNRSGLLTVSGADKKNYALRVAEFRKYMLATYGAPTIRAVGRTKNSDGVVVDTNPATFAGRQGIIMFDVGVWDDATGHFDLWNGTQAAHDAYFADARAVWLWEVK
jgi:Type VI secretion system (T6SS), amidase effector protein 4